MASAEIIIFPGEVLIPMRVPDKNSTSGEKIIMVPYRPTVKPSITITYPSELLPPNDDGTDVAVVVYPDGVPFQ